MSLSRIESTLKALVNSMTDGGEGYLVEFGGMLYDEKPGKQVAESRIKELLEEFECVFREPEGLPPKRDQ